MQQLKGLQVLITGGTTGIGFATAELFASEGAKVAITGQSQDRVDAAIGKLGAGAIGFTADQASVEDLARLAKDVEKRLNHLDILVLNAGITVLGGTQEVTESQFDHQLATNLKGPFFTVAKLAPLMRDGGAIIANTSCLDQLGMPGMAVYSATKAALRSMVRTWAAELLPRRIRVNAVAPGPIETPLYGKLGLLPEHLEGMANSVVSQVPMKRFGSAADIAGPMLFLASSQSAYMTGEEITVSGGWGAL